MDINSKRKKIVLIRKKGKKMALAAMIKKDSYRDSLKLTKEKKEILRKAIGSAPSKIDYNRVRDYLKYGDR